MKIKCLVIDDEPLAIEVIENHLSKFDLFEVEATCSSAMEAFEILNKKKIDLMFLDIQMPGMKGTEFLKNLKNPPKVMLTTAYREYALEGYELDVVDYLLKPVSFDRFFKAINKYLNSQSGEVMVYSQESNPAANFIYVKANKKVNKILLRDILYIESVKDYITIHESSRDIQAKHTISAFEEKLPAGEFLRIHRSYIVSLKNITGFTAHSIDINGIELPIGSSYRQHVFKALNFNDILD